MRNDELVSRELASLHFNLVLLLVIIGIAVLVNL